MGNDFLFTRIKQGDEKALEKFTKENYLFFCALANRYVNDVQEAEDIVQEVFVKLLTKRVIFKDEEHIKSWLIRVTINQCLDYKKSLTKKSTVPIENMEIPFEQKEGEILEELQLLKEDERNVLYLHYYEGYKIKEIAKILKQKQNTINSKLTRARKKLKEIMEVEYE